ncbi:MAG: AraC family transcriptional regulator [Flavobacteriales bacterium]
MKQRDLTELDPAEKYALLNRVLQRSMTPDAEESRSELIDRMKQTIIQAIRSEERQVPKFSLYLSKELHYCYAYLSRQFSLGNECTLERYIIEQKIEWAKELLFTDRHTLSEIAWKLGYSSVAHLSSQFKKVTGFTPTHFKLMDPTPDKRGTTVSAKYPLSFAQPSHGELRR